MFRAQLYRDRWVARKIKHFQLHLNAARNRMKLLKTIKMNHFKRFFFVNMFVILENLQTLYSPNILILTFDV